MLRSKRLRRIALRVVFAFAVFVLVLGGLWLALPAISEYAAETTLPEHGIEVAKVEIEDIALEQTTLGPVTLEADSWKLELERGKIGYDARELLSDQRLQSLELDGLAIELLPSLFEAFEAEGEGAGSEGIDLKLLEGSLVRSVVVNQGILHVPFENVPVIEWSVDAQLEDGEDPVVKLDAKTELADASIRVMVDSEQSVLAETEIDVLDTMEVLGRVMPDWRELFGVPEALEFWLDALSIDSSSEGKGFDDWRTAVQLRLPALSLAYDPGVFDLEQIVVDLETSAEGLVQGRFSAVVKNGSWEAFSLRSGELLVFDFLYDGAESLAISTKDPVAWSYDNGEIRGVANVELRANLGESIQFDGVIHESQLVVSEISVTPFVVELEGNQESIRFAIEEMSSELYPHFRLLDVEGNLFPENEEGSTHVKLAARIAGNSFSALFEECEHPAIGFELESASGDTRNQFELTLNPDSVLQTFDLADTSVSGAYKLMLKGVDEGLDDVWDLKAILEAQGLLVESESVTADGVVLNLSVVMDNLDTLALEDPDLDGVVLAHRLMETTELKLDWQANQVESADLMAQWSGGSVMLKPAVGRDHSAANLQITGGAGILKVGNEALQQVYLSSESLASIEQVETSAELSFMYQGQTGQVVLTQSASSLFEAPEVLGTFTLAPYTFQYSDLLGRFDENLQGVSFSGILEGMGEYKYATGDLSVEMESLFKDGSVDAPGHQVEAEGIAIWLDWARLDADRFFPTRFGIEVANTRVGDLDAAKLLVEAEFESDNQIEITKAQVEAYGGDVYLRPTALSIEPFACDGSLVFERLSLDAITAEMEFFRGDMVGRVSGELPIRYQDGELLLDEGYLNLPTGEIAQLRYNASDVFRSGNTGELPTRRGLGDVMLEKLEIDPEGFVEDALANLSISELQVELFPKDTPLTPVRIELSGEATSGSTKIPLHLQTNVNGTLEELFNFLLRLNSL